MKNHLLLAAAAGFLTLNALTAAENPAGIPENYQLVYSSKFTPGEAVTEFVLSDPAAWKISDADGKGSLELAKQSKYKPPVRSPANVALLANKSFGDVIFEADCLQTGREYGHRDMVFFYGFQGPSRFYYTHIATAADDHAHNCFIVNDAPRLKFGSKLTKGVIWGSNVWHHVRIERKAEAGTVRVFYDDMTVPIMEAEDKTFATGAIGFGSFDDTGKITNIKVWAPKVEEKKTEPFVSAP